MEFQEEKYKAMKYFLGKVGTTIEDELKYHLEKTYQKAAPKPIQGYYTAIEAEQCRQDIQNTDISAKNSNESAAVQEESKEQPERPVRLTRRHREAVSQEHSHATPPNMQYESMPDEDKNQGMAINM